MVRKRQPQLDIEQYFLHKDYWLRTNECGNCYMGPCMCGKVQGLKCQPVPAGKDEHMVPVDAALIAGKTVAFVMDLRDSFVEERHLPMSEFKQKELWGEHYGERSKFAILKPSVGWRSVKRIVR